MKISHERRLDLVNCDNVLGRVIDTVFRKLCFLQQGLHDQLISYNIRKSHTIPRGVRNFQSPRCGCSLTSTLGMLYEIDGTYPFIEDEKRPPLECNL